jgi:hypothetical protein
MGVLKTGYQGWTITKAERTDATTKFLHFLRSLKLAGICNTDRRNSNRCTGSTQGRYTGTHRERPLAIESRWANAFY